MFRTATGLHETVDSAVNAAWENKGKMDWHGLENCLREYLSTIPVDRQTHEVKMIDEILAAFSHRGHTYN